MLRDKFPFINIYPFLSRSIYQKKDEQTLHSAHPHR